MRMRTVQATATTNNTNTDTNTNTTPTTTNSQKQKKARNPPVASRRAPDSGPLARHRPPSTAILPASSEKKQKKNGNNRKRRVKTRWNAVLRPIVGDPPSDSRVIHESQPLLLSPYTTHSRVWSLYPNPKRLDGIVSSHRAHFALRRVSHASRPLVPAPPPPQ